MFGLKDNYYQEIYKIIKKYSLSKVLVFGSRARGDFHKKSDLDLALLDSIEHKKFIKIYADLRDLDIPYKIDLLDFNNLQNQKLRENVIKDGVSFSA